MLHFYNSFDATSPNRMVAFRSLIRLIKQERKLSIMVSNVRDVVQVSKDWRISMEERLDLYKLCAQVLEDNNEGLYSFRIMLEFIRAYNGVKLDKEKLEVIALAKKTALQGIKELKAINIEELLATDVFQNHKTSNLKEVCQVLELFISGDIKDFEKNVKSFSKLLSEGNVSTEQAVLKKQCMSVCTLKLHKSNVSYKELSQLLNVSFES